MKIYYKIKNVNYNILLKKYKYLNIYKNRYNK